MGRNFCLEGKKPDNLHKTDRVLGGCQGAKIDLAAALRAILSENTL